MKKFLLLAMFAITMQLANAQDLKKVEIAYKINKMEDAKTEVDKAIADPKQQGKPDAMYWKAKVYAAIYKDPKLRDKYPTAMKDADDASRKYLEMDPSLAVLKANGAEGFFDMYATAYASGVKFFNDKKWDDAASNFKVAVDYSDLIFKNKWTKTDIPFDTTSILYLGYSYQNASKHDEAAKYYGRLADAKVAGDNFIDLYKYLVNHYMLAKNEAQFKKYIALGKELYPKNAWDEFEIEYMDQNLSLTQKAELYDKDDAAGTMSELQYLQFGDIFVGAKSKEKNPGLDSAKIAMYTMKAADAFKKAYAKNPKNGVAAYNVGVIYYNIYLEHDDTYAANIRAMQALNADRPVEKDPKKKAAADAKLKEQLDPIKKANADLEKPLMDNLDMSLDWLEKAYNALKDKTPKIAVEKNVINKSVDFLANLYAYKRDRLRGKDAKAYDAYDAKYKEYDGLHGKF